MSDIASGAALMLRLAHLATVPFALLAPSAWRNPYPTLPTREEIAARLALVPDAETPSREE